MGCSVFGSLFDSRTLLMNQIKAPEKFIIIINELNCEARTGQIIMHLQQIVENNQRSAIRA